MKRKKVIVCIVFVLVWAIFMTPMIISIFHSLPSADDFSMAVGIKNRSDLLGMSIKRANGFYMSWSGSWSAIFLETVLNPLVWFKGKGAIAALRIGLILNCAVFITVLVLLWNSICKNLLNIESAVIRNVLSIIVVWGILLGNVYSEIFYWYVGSVYSWHMTFAMLSIIGMIEYFFGRQNKDSQLVLLTVWGSLACSLLNFIVPVILIYIFILCSSRKRNTWKNKYYLPLIVFCVIGAVTVFAPGNFARHQVIDDSGVHIVKGGINTIIASIEETLVLIRKPSIVLALFFFLVAGCWLYSKKYTIRVQLFWVMIFGILAVCGSIFPVMVGYSDSSMSNRIQFVYDVQWLVWGCLLTVSAGYYLAKYFHVKEINPIYMVLILACFMFIKVGDYGKTAYYEIWDNREKIAYEEEEWRSILQEIEYSQDDTVEIVYDKIPESFIIKNPELGRDQKYWSWVEEAVADYYDKKSVRVVWNE